METANLRWNLLRCNRLEPSAPIHYSFEAIPLIQEPNIPDPHMFHPYFFLKALHGLSLAEKLSFLHQSDTTATKTLLVARRVHGPDLGQRQ